MSTPARILHALAGAPEVDGCAPVEPCRCYMCAASTERGAPVRRWMGSTFTDQPRCACPSSDVICEACVWACSWVTPPGYVVTPEMAAKKAAKRAKQAAERAAAGKPPPGPEKGENLRLFSHLYDAGEYRYVNKADKPAIREFLRKPKRGPWFAAIADSGQKHTVPFAPLNPGPFGAILFEEAVVELPDEPDAWRVLDDAIDLLTAGATKEEITRGEYRPETWLRCRERIEAFERDHGALRGGAFFDLVVWLAQRDEAAVAERLEREKEAKKAKEEKRRGRIKKAGAQGGDGRGCARAARSVPRSGSQASAEALDADRGADEVRREDVDVARGVGDGDEARIADRRYEQTSLFGDDALG